MQKMAGTFTKTSGQITSFTPAYGAPEQFSRTHGATGPWTDVFALALIFAEVCTGHEPLQGDDFVQLAVASGSTERRPTPRTPRRAGERRSRGGLPQGARREADRAMAVGRRVLERAPAGHADGPHSVRDRPHAAP